MLRLEPLLTILAALTLGVLVVNFSGGATVVHAPSVATSATASSTPSSIEPKVVATTTQAQATPPAPVKKKKTAPVTPTTPVSTPPHPTPIVAPSLPVVTDAQLNASAAVLRAALVNILCRVSTKSGLHIISGSGVFIDAKGIILTNAHVAEYFLLADRGASCVIRSGSPATDQYQASLIFISPAWIHANANVISETAPTGTGEYDLALLTVTKSVTSSPLPPSFPSMPLATTPLTSGTPVVIGSYGAQFLDQSQIQTALSPILVFGSVKNVFTFATNTIDVLALGGSAAAQEGSSGGGVTDASGTLAGTITTSTVDGATASRSLDAITTPYIRNDYLSETGQSLDFLLSQPIVFSIANFAPQIPALEAIVVANL